MNLGCEDDELKPYIEPQPDINDVARIGNASRRHRHSFGTLASSCPATSNHFVSVIYFCFVYQKDKPFIFYFFGLHNEFVCMCVCVAL